MSGNTVVFVSHKSLDSPRAVALAQAIDVAGGLRAVVDAEHLRDGASWRDQLYRWLARCDAGVVLLTAAAVAEPGWVLLETTLLRARKFHEPSFPLLAIIDDEARAHPNFKLLFEALALDEIQAPRQPLTPAALADRVAQACAPQRAQRASDLLSRLRTRLDGALRPLLANDAALSATVLDALGADDARWRDIVGEDRVVAGALAERLCDSDEAGRIGQLPGLRKLMQIFFGHGLREQRCNLLNLLRPYWVHLEAALRMAAVMRAPPGQRLCILRTSLGDLAPRLVIQRVCVPWDCMPNLLDVAGGDESLPDLTAQVVDGWNAQFPTLKAADAAQLNRRLAQFGGEDVVAILPPLHAPALARALAAAFPQLCFVMTVPEGEIDLSAPGWQGITRIEPSRPADAEEGFEFDFGRARDLAEQS